MLCCLVLPRTYKAVQAATTTAPNFADKTIWTGDTLDILRGMNFDCVDLIYLDPPFNSNRNYAATIGSAAAGWWASTYPRSPSCCSL